MVCRLDFCSCLFSLLRPAGDIHLFLYTYGRPRNDVVIPCVGLMTFPVGRFTFLLSARHCEADGWLYKFLSLLSWPKQSYLKWKDVRPENGEKFAEQFVDVVRRNEKINLDYSVDTLDFVDKFLQRFSDEGLAVNDFAETIFVAGAYVGQVMIKNRNGVWIKGDELNLPEGISMMPIVVKLSGRTVADPIAKAFKRFYFGESDDIKYFYKIFTER